MCLKYSKGIFYESLLNSVDAETITFTKTYFMDNPFTVL